MKDILALIAVLAFLLGIIVIPLTVWRVFKGTNKTFGDVFALAAAQQTKAKQKERETIVFRLASNQGGRVTAFQVSQSTDLTLAEAGEYLESLVLAGAAEMTVQDSGTIEYRITLS